MCSSGGWRGKAACAEEQVVVVTESDSGDEWWWWSLAWRRLMLGFVGDSVRERSSTSDWTCT